MNNLKFKKSKLKTKKILYKSGFIKLSDFWLSKVFDKIFELNNKEVDGEYELNSQEKNYSWIGIVHYVISENLNKKEYGPGNDWLNIGLFSSKW